MRRFLKALSICYGVAFFLHIADLLNLRLELSAMRPGWKAWVIYLTVMDAIAAVGLWKCTRWGAAAFLLVAFSQLVAYLGFKSFFGEQTFLIWFQIVTLASYLVLRLLFPLSKPKLADDTTF